MENNSIEMSLLDPEEREEIEAIHQIIPEEDRKQISLDDVLFVLDTVDDYLQEVGLLEIDEASGEATYLEGEVDDTEQLEYLLKAAKKYHYHLTGAQIQVILDADMQYGIEQGWCPDED